MKITAQLPGVNRPLSVELRLINFCSCDFDSREENHTAPGQLLLTERSGFRSAEGSVRYNHFGGAAFGEASRLGSLLNGKQSPNILLIPGTASVGPLRENLAAAKLTLSAETWPSWTGSPPPGVDELPSSPSAHVR